LMHDIGNPLFGHFREAAIQIWLRNVLGGAQTGEEDKCQTAALRLTGSPQANHLRCQLRRDLCLFEGNAQGMRMAHHLLKLNLTFAQIGSVLKYTRPAWQLEP
ncbi:deoxyguanosinetriphosphate triphosphohydrolase, partial [Proteus mirabilis]|nr:deoxyguanosinetriphosphate triphosphohydrolase [Proteus mirabilis]